MMVGRLFNARERERERERLREQERGLRAKDAVKNGRPRKYPSRRRRRKKKRKSKKGNESRTEVRA